jgi:predicted TIM-barrel enzyme
MNPLPHRRQMIAAAAAQQSRATALADAGVDALVAYHSSVYRDRGIASVAGLLPWDSANRQTAQILPDVVGGVARATRDVPVVATVCANDALRPIDTVVSRLARAGARAVLNAPTMGLHSGPVREALEAAGLGRAAEIELIHHAHRAGVQAWCYVFDAEWVALAAAAGADAYIVHLGLTAPRSGNAPYPADRMAAALGQARSCLAGIDVVALDAPVFLHGGPLTRPEAFVDLVNRLPPRTSGRPVGFFGGSALDGPADDPAQALRHWRDRLDLLLENPA